MSARLLIGDVIERLAEIPDGSIDLIVTSPPFLALRSYLPAEHPDKAREIGSEATPAEFLSTLLRLTVEWRRVLAPHGSIAVELGDTYSGSGGAGGDYNADGMRDGQQRFNGAAAKARAHATKERTRYPNGRAAQARTTHLGPRGRLDGHAEPGSPGGHHLGGVPGWPLDKSLCMIPELYAASLAYGRNLLAPDHIIERWRVRNWITWARPNPPVGALADKWRPASSFITVACVGRQRYFDLDAVRTTLTEPDRVFASKLDHNPSHGEPSDRPFAQNGNGAPPLDWHSDLDDDAGIGLLILSTQPYKGAHYATFPSALPQRLIDCMCPQQVCRTCGKPSERIAERTNATGRGMLRSRPGHERQVTSTHQPDFAEVVTLGWSDCGHNDWRKGMVLDPFAGSGTTLAVAVGMGRDAIGIDLDDRNADLARDRVGMFLEVVA